MSTPWGSGFHAPPVGGVDASAYDRYIGRWSRLFVPALLSAADLRVGYRVLDVATGSGEAAIAATSAVGDSGTMIGVDISSAMLGAAVGRMAGKSFLPVVANGQSLPFPDASFDAVLRHLGLVYLTACRFPDRDGGIDVSAVLKGILAACFMARNKDKRQEPQGDDT